MAYSDSTIQTYQYIPVRKSFELLLVGRYKSCCLMQASHHMIADELYLCTAGTDGYLAFFNLTHPLRSKGITVHDGRLLRRTSVPSPTATAKWQYRTAIHQSSIKSMTTVRIDAHTLLLASGGDDNALAFTLARFSSSSAPSFSTLLLPTAHASAITASLTCPSSPSDESTETMRFATTSNDQRLKLWGVTLDTALPGVQGLQVQRIGNEASPVADAGGMAVLNDGMSAAGEEESGRAKIVLVGVGVDVWAV
ncbi:MAG: hypothetical protein M1832_000786 [Thelocarpon impressellum]|nr:MAG: hypothetical protein M1832_000786 [Thelocarpon impressellum]